MNFLLFFFFSLSTSFSIVSSSTISLGSSISASNPTQSWSSSNNTFSISFIPSPSSSNSFLAAITFAGGVPVWTAGGGAAVDSGGSLRLLSNGALHLINGSGAVVWDSGTANQGVSSASLEESGELLLSNGTATVWSSFDHPTDTIVPDQNFTSGGVLKSGLYSFTIQSYNDSNPICGCPSENFEPVDVNDRRQGCKRKVEIANCPGSAAMLQLDHAGFLTYQPELSSQVFFVGISACRLNCLVSPSCVASTSLSDGTGQCYLKTTEFVSGYQNPALPSTSYVKVCGPVLPNPSPFADNAGNSKEIERPPAPKAATEGSISGTSINLSSNMSAFSTFAASAPAPSSSSSLQTAGVSPLASGRNIEKQSSSLLHSGTK
ncbi:hypothetical protein CCACVL1_25925 [Corchorus capsularis]|uniref:non-specific serine/threonine protein kinase n=1 Tax=Corchorus capsularis TaxID=210143 RepID=A0A1R3GGF9_COCAP|nr:hypothetical protein CCACVL1_25925 [Corchorus capsularis]